MFRWSLRALAGLVLGTLAACQPQAPLRELAIAQAGVVLNVPADWTAGPSPGSLLLLRPADEGRPVPGSFLLVARDAPQPGFAPELAGFAEFKQRQVVSRWLRFSLLDRRTLRIGPLAAERREWLGTDYAGQRRSLALLWVAQGQGYSLVASAPAREAPRVWWHFRRALASARVEALAPPPVAGGVGERFPRARPEQLRALRARAAPVNPLAQQEGRWQGRIP